MSNAQATGYPVTLREEARRLGKAGWEPIEIVRILARRGVDPLPTPGAVRWWLKGARDFERQMEHQRRSMARKNAEKSGGRMLGGRDRTDEFKLLRVRALLDAGVPLASVARVMSFDFEPVTKQQLERALRTGQYPASPRRSS